MSDLNYCSNCGSASIGLKIPKGDTYKRFVCENCGTIYYSNPRVIVGCLPVYEDKVMLCRRAIQPQLGLWNLPAGFLENNEKAEEGAVRETFEESRAQVDIIKLHVVFSLPKVNQVYLHFLAKLNELSFGPTSESSEVKLFAKTKSPGMISLFIPLFMPLRNTLKMASATRESMWAAMVEDRSGKYKFTSPNQFQPS